MIKRSLVFLLLLPVLAEAKEIDEYLWIDHGNGMAATCDPGGSEARGGDGEGLEAGGGKELWGGHREKGKGD